MARDQIVVAGDSRPIGLECRFLSNPCGGGRGCAHKLAREKAENENNSQRCEMANWPNLRDGKGFRVQWIVPKRGIGSEAAVLKTRVSREKISGKPTCRVFYRHGSGLVRIAHVRSQFKIIRFNEFEVS